MIKVKHVNWIDLDKGSIEVKDVTFQSDEEREVDGTGKYLMPGLVDMHTHITPVSAKHYLASGVTSVRNTGGNYELIQMMDDIAPHVYATYRFIDGEPGLWGPTSFGNVSTNDIDTAMEAVEELYNQDAKFIKVYGHIQEDVLGAVVKRGGTLGLEVAADLLHSKVIDAMKATEYGVKWLEHASSIVQHLFPGYHSELSDEAFDTITSKPIDTDRLNNLLSYLLEHEVKLVPTLTLYRHLAEGCTFNPPELVSSKQMKLVEADEQLSINTQFETIDAQLSEAFKKRQKWEYEQVKRVTGKYLERGGEVYIGTDAPAGTWVYPGLSMIKELNEFKDFSLADFEILRKATIEAKKIVGEDDGYILLNQNPLENFEHILDIDAIFLAGKILMYEDIKNHQVDSYSMMKKFEEIEEIYRQQ